MTELRDNLEAALLLHQFTVLKPAEVILDSGPWRMTETLWGCKCGWEGSNEALAKDETPGDAIRQHQVDILWQMFFDLQKRVEDAVDRLPVTTQHDYHGRLTAKWVSLDDVQTAVGVMLVEKMLERFVLDRQP